MPSLSALSRLSSRGKALVLAAVVVVGAAALVSAIALGSSAPAPHTTSVSATGARPTSSVPGSASSSAPAGSAAVPPVAAAPAASAQPAMSRCTLTSGAQTLNGRQGYLDVPAQTPALVIIDYHGGDQSAAQEHGYTGLGAFGKEHGYLVVTPSGTRGLWNFTGHEAGLPDDIAYTQGVIDQLAKAGCANANEVYTAGISDGADMAVAAACQLPEAKAVFAVAPSIIPRVACNPKKSYLEVHGTNDPVVPYSGTASGSFPDVPSQPVSERLDWWHQGCSTANPLPGVPAGVQAQAWSCGTYTVELDPVPGGGHTWPGAAGSGPAGTGAQASWSANARAVEFFDAHR